MATKKKTKKKKSVRDVVKDMVDVIPPEQFKSVLQARLKEAVEQQLTRYNFCEYKSLFQGKVRARVRQLIKEGFMEKEIDEAAKIILKKSIQNLIEDA